MKVRHTIACASYLLLFKEGKVFLMRRFNTGYEDGNYSVPAGHVEEEHMTDALIREAKEEAGIILDKKNIRLVHIMHRKSSASNDERMDFFFTADEWRGTPQHQETDKCDQSGWFDLDHLPDNVIPYIRTAIENSSSDVLYSERG